MPDLTPAEFERLVADIEAVGQIEPIWLGPDGEIVDGWHRLRACLELGREPRFERMPRDIDSISYVVSLGIRRRHLRPGALREVEARLRRYVPADGRLAAALRERVPRESCKRGGANDAAPLDADEAEAGPQRPIDILVQQGREDFAELAASLKHLIAELARVSATPCGRWLREYVPEMRRVLGGQIARDIEGAGPGCVCDGCAGDGCELCRQAGWLSVARVSEGAANATE